jgi:hypothetical protein
MKRIKLVIIVLLALSLTGCIEKYNATDEQSDAIAEYMAGHLLDSDKDYDQKLIPEDELLGDNSNESVDNGSDNNSGEVTITPVTPNPSDAAPSDSAVEGTDNAGVLYTLTEVIDSAGFQIEYSSYKLTNQYKSQYFVLNPRDGCQLLVMSFSIKNVADEKQVLNLTKAGIEYKISDKSDTKYKPLLTLLENDLQYIKMEFGGGKSKKGVLIFDIPNDSEIAGMKLTATNQEKQSEVVIK